MKPPLKRVKTEPYEPPIGKPIIAIDPGSARSAWVTMQSIAIGGDKRVIKVEQFDLEPNEALEKRLRGGHFTVDLVAAAAELPSPRGQMLTWQIVDTCVWFGDFRAVFRGPTWVPVDRSDVKMHITGNPRAKDSNIRAALIERWGGKEVAVGKKASPGPLYGMTKDMWQALAVGITYLERGAYRKVVHSW